MNSQYNELSFQVDAPKKGSLDSLTREELVIKCKSLVGTLLKAKQDKEGNNLTAAHDCDILLMNILCRNGGQKEHIRRNRGNIE